VTDIATGDTVIHLKPAEEAPAPAPAPADAVRRAPFDVLTFTRQGTLLVTSFGSRDLVFWDPQTGKRVRKVLPALSDEEKATLLPGLRISPAFSPDGRFVATLGALNRVAVYETASGIQRRLLPAAQGDISSVQFSVDGRSLATASTDGTVLIWDMTATPAANETHDEVKLQDLWDDLAANDGAKVDRAILRLARLGKEALAFLRERMQADSRANAGKEIDKLIADLDGDDFEVRTRAHEELIKQGMKAKPALQRALTNDPSLELQKRLEELLKKLEDQPPLPEESRRLRVVEVLERSGSPEAIEFLRELAKGPKGHPLTVDAAAALARLGH
jgi:hypothetical protein